MPQVNKKDGESNDALMRRFTRKVQSSGLLLQTKKRLFFKRKENDRKVKESKLRRLEKKAERDHDIRIGKVEEKKRYFRKN